jgi:uncharacterized protein YmfQ (DUF2313 family)
MYNQHRFDNVVYNGGKLMYARVPTYIRSIAGAVIRERSVSNQSPTSYTKRVLTTGETSTIRFHIVDLMKYLPSYYNRSTIMKAIQEAYAEEFVYVKSSIHDFTKQFLTPVTATKGLRYWEQELGLPTDVSKSYEERRAIVLSRLKGISAVGKNVIKRAAEAFSGGDVDVIEYPAEHRFVVKFVGTLGIPKNMASFIEMIEDLKPAHLTYGFEYTYTWWNTLKELTWAQAGLGTWNDLRVYK